MVFKVEMGSLPAWGLTRSVNVPDNQLDGVVLHDLSLIWSYGQNEMQNQNERSVSVGDVINYKGERYLIEAIGFSKLTGVE